MRTPRYGQPALALAALVLTWGCTAENTDAVEVDGPPTTSIEDATSSSDEFEPVTSGDATTTPSPAVQAGPNELVIGEHRYQLGEIKCDVQSGLHLAGAFNGSGHLIGGFAVEVWDPYRIDETIGRLLPGQSNGEALVGELTLFDESGTVFLVDWGNDAVPGPTTGAQGEFANGAGMVSEDEFDEILDRFKAELGWDTWSEIAALEGGRELTAAEVHRFTSIYRDVAAAVPWSYGVVCP